jgi:hypothetical protein
MAAARVPTTIAFVHPQDPGWAEPLIDTLRRYGYHVVFAATVCEAEVLMAILGLASFDLIITTVQPGRQDQTGARCVAHVPWILIGDGPTPDGLAPPVVWWLATPLTPETLLAAIRDTLGW